MLGIMELLIFVCICCYFIGKNRTSTMIDIITTRFHEVYTSWIVTEHTKQHHTTNFVKEQHITSIKRFSEDHQKMFPAVKEEKEIICNGKVETVKDDTSSISPMDGLICQDCSRNLNRQSQLNAIDRTLTAVDILTVTQHASSNEKNDWGTYFPHLAQNLRLKKYEYKPVFDKVLNHKHVRHEIERVARDAVRSSDVNFENEDSYYEEMLNKYTKKAHQLLMDMRHTLSDKLLRLTSYVLYKLLPWFLSGVVAHPAQIEMLKIAQKKMPDTPLIFLPLHRSHLDYILVTFILLNNDIKCPQVAAGNNLDIPVFGYLLRGLGAFYIKRKIDDGADGKKDFIYRSLLQAYIQESVTAGHNIEFFIEGGRTRTGKPNMPKSGILSVIVEAFIDGLIKDAILVPVSVNYERLVDGNFVNEQMGTPKKKESFKFAMSSIWKILNSKYGQMRIDFNEPFSLRELVSSFKERQNTIDRTMPSARKLTTGPSTTSMYGIEVIDRHRALVDSIARHVVYDCSYATSVMSTNIVAYLLLNKYRNGTTLKDISHTLSELRKQIEGDREIGFENDSDAVVMRAVTLLGPGLILSKPQLNGDVFIEPVLMVPNVIETAYYANTFTPHYALDSAVVTSIASSVNEGAPLGMTDLIETAMLFCDVLRYEFIFCKPCQELAEQIENSVNRLCKLGIVSRVNDDGDVSFNFASSKTLLSTLAPFSVTYVSVAKCLKKLHEKSSMLEKDFIKLCLGYIHGKFNNGAITYGECISTDSIKNCLKLLEKWTIVEVDAHSGVRIISLSQLYNSMAGVQSIVDKIGRFVILK